MGIKGHMTIELADAKTGKIVERHEDDNLVTNGVKHYMKNMGMFNITPFNTVSNGMFAQHANNLAIPLFGGLLLFDTAQTANAEHLFEIHMRLHKNGGIIHSGLSFATHSIYRYNNRPCPCRLRTED